MGARVIKAIESSETTRGDGAEVALRVITKYFDEGGQLLAEADPHEAVENAFLLGAVEAAFKFVRENDPDGGEARQLAFNLHAAVKILRERPRLESQA